MARKIGNRKRIALAIAHAEMILRESHGPMTDEWILKDIDETMNEMESLIKNIEDWSFEWCFYETKKMKILTRCLQCYKILIESNCDPKGLDKIIFNNAKGVIKDYESKRYLDPDYLSNRYV